MSMYNMLFGFNPACVFLLPMLGKKQEEYPRFRDCFLSDDQERIVVYTRTGGNNREDYEEENNVLFSDPLYVRDYDDDFDNTYMYVEFVVPGQWEEDFKKVKNGNLLDVSKEYKELIKSFYPKIYAKLYQEEA